MGLIYPAPHPEDAALAVIAAFSRTYNLTITASRGVWTVTGDGLDQPLEVESYTDLVTTLTSRYGWPTP